MNAPIGWRVIIGVMPRENGLLLVGKCSCGAVEAHASLDEGDAWEFVSKAVGGHVKRVHLKES